MSFTGNEQIEELFPELRGLLSNWETAPQAQEGLVNENGVEASDIEQAMMRRLQASPYPQFQSGQTAPPPPQSHVEQGDGPAPGPAPLSPMPSTSAPPASPDSTEFRPGPTSQPQPAPQPSEPTSAPPTPQAPPEGSQGLPPTADEGVTIGHDADGNPIVVPLSRLQTYAQFDQEFQSDPGLRQAVLDYYQASQQGFATPTDVGGPATAPSPQGSPVSPTTPFPESPPAGMPSDVDLEDPAIRYLLDQQRQLTNQIQMLAGGVQLTYQEQQRRQQVEHDSLINRAMESFKTQHGLDDKQMGAIREAAGRLNIVPALMQGIDPITGAPSKPDPLSALDRAFEIAYMQIPEFRDREFGRMVAARVQDSRRKQKLAGISGSSGSVPRTQPAPTTPQGRRSAMIEEIRQMQNGEWTPPDN